MRPPERMEELASQGVRCMLTGGVAALVGSEDWLESEGWAVQGITESPITGPEGNIEFLISAIHGETAVDVA